MTRPGTPEDVRVQLEYMTDRVLMLHAGHMTGLTAEVARASSATEAHLIVGMLESNGIAARASADDAGGLEPQWQLTAGVRVLVAPEDAEPARRLVTEANSGASSQVTRVPPGSKASVWPGAPRRAGDFAVAEAESVQEVTGIQARRTAP